MFPNSNPNITRSKRNTKTHKCFMCQWYGYIALCCLNRKTIFIIKGNIHNDFEEENKYVHEAFEERRWENHIGWRICS